MARRPQIYARMEALDVGLGILRTKITLAIGKSYGERVCVCPVFFVAEADAGGRGPKTLFQVVEMAREDRRRWRTHADEIGAEQVVVVFAEKSAQGANLARRSREEHLAASLQGGFHFRPHAALVALHIF